MESSFTAVLLALQFLSGSASAPGHHSSQVWSPAGRAAQETNPDWVGLARDVLDELAVLRSDPEAYAGHLEELLPRFRGNILQRPGRRDLVTEEGATAVREAIAVLRRTRKLAAPSPSEGMSQGAADHVRDQGRSGGLEHEGTDGSTPASRVGRYGRWRHGIAESMAFGENPARDVIVQLLVDDGVPDRGHRTMLLHPAYRAAGAACGSHAQYRQMCVIVLAVEFLEGGR